MRINWWYARSTWERKAGAIVTGAPNITEKSIGVKVPVVLDGGNGEAGGRLPEEGIWISKSRWAALIPAA